MSAGTGDQPLTSRTGASIILATGLGMMTSVGIMLLYPLGVLVPAIAADTTWSKASIAASAAPALLIVGICGPAVGYLVDRFGPRRVLLWGVLGQGSGLLLLGLATPSIATFALFYSLAALLGAAQAHVPYAQAIAGWFRTRRGAAAGIGFGMAGVGVAVIPLLTQFMIEVAGWRQAIISLGFVAWLVAGSATFFLMRDPPTPEPVSSNPISGDTRIPLRDAGFWLLVFAFAANAFAASAGTVSLPMILVADGMTPLAAASAMGALGAAMIFGRVAVGVLLDYVQPNGLAVFIFMMPMIGCVVIANAGGGYQAIIGGTLFAIALGAEGDLMAYLIARRTDLSSFGRLFGIAYLGYAVASGLGPATFTVVGGTANLGLALAIAGGVSLAGAVLVAVAAISDTSATSSGRH